MGWGSSPADRASKEKDNQKDIKGLMARATKEKESKDSWGKKQATGGK